MMAITQRGQQREMNKEKLQILRVAARRTGFLGERGDRVVRMPVQETARGGWTRYISVWMDTFSFVSDNG